MHFVVTIGSAHAHVISPGTGRTIKGLGLSKAAGANLVSAATAGNFVRLVALNSTTWYITQSRGTWS